MRGDTLIGETLDGRYKLRKKLGSGGMAKVYLATDLSTQKSVAIKVLSVGANVSLESIKRFEREFTICSKLENKNIVRLYSLGRTAKDTPYFALEYIDGQTLGDYMAQKTPLPIEETVKILSAVLNALVEFHQHKIVHRDLKPDNIMLTQKGRVVVMDFGLARDLDKTALTETGAILGTPWYMSPELAQGEKSDNRSDLWQVGALAYEMLTGERPFDEDDIGAVLAKIIFSEPNWKIVPPKCLDFIKNSLRKNPAQRYPSAQIALAALQDIVEIAPPPKEEGRRSFGPLLLFLSFASFFLLLHLSGESSSSYDVHSLRVRSYVDGFSFSWRSSSPYLTQVQLTRGEERCIFSGHSSEAHTSHAIEVKGLAVGAKYTLKILFPDGSLSFPTKVETKTYKCHIKSSKVLDGFLHIDLLTEPPSEFVLKVLAGLSEKLYEGNRNGVFSIPLSKSFIKKVILEAKLPNGEKCELNLGAELKAKSINLTRQLSSFDQHFILRDLTVPHWTTPSTVVKPLAGKDRVRKDRLKLDGHKGDKVFLQKCAFVKRELRKRLQESNLLGKYKEAIRLTPLLFETKIIDYSTKQKFHQVLNKFLSVHIFSCLADAETGLLKIPHYGDHSLTLERPLNLFGEVVLHKDKGPKLYIGQQAPFRSLTHPHWGQKFTIKSLHGAIGGVLFFKLRRIHRMAIGCRVNKSFQALVYGQPILYEGEDTRKELYQYIPLESLHKGENTLELTHETFVKKGLETKASISALHFYLLAAQ